MFSISKMVVVHRPENETIENKLQKLEEEFQEIKARISDLRKSGKDTQIAEVLVLDFAPKVKMARATYDDADITKIRELLDNIKLELNESEDGTDFSHVNELIKEAYEYLRTGRIKEAKIAYSAVKKEYRKLPDEFKRLVYHACLDIKKKIEESPILD